MRGGWCATSVIALTGLLTEYGTQTEHYSLNTGAAVAVVFLKSTIASTVLQSNVGMITEYCIMNIGT